MRKKSCRGVTCFIAVLLLSVTGVEVCRAQTVNMNSVRTRVPQIPVTDTTKLDTIPVQRQAVSIKYMDPFGRALQTIEVQGSPNKDDILVPYVYDNMGRAVKMYLPYADESTTSGTAGSYRGTATGSVAAFYNPSSPGAPKMATDASPFAQRVYEASPLGRVIEQGAPGAVFQPGTGHTVTTSYQVNNKADGINYYYNIHEQSYANRSPFTAGTLAKTIITDENGHRVAVWKDLLGRVVSKQQLDGPSAYYSTDYVYNDMGQLSYFATPAAKRQIATGGGYLFGAGFNTLAYAYHYDSVGRVVEKKLPSKGWVYTVYNRADRPVLSQDSNQRVKNQWNFMKYDGQGRIVQTGIYTNTVTTSRKALQALCDNSYPVLWETWQPGTGYTDNAFPQQSMTPSAVPLVNYTILYYDDYSFTEAGSKPFKTNIYNAAPTLRTGGKLTGLSVYVLGTASQRLVSVYYYDYKGHLIQLQRDNHLGQADVINAQYNFIGELTGSQEVTTPFAGQPITKQDRYVYDQAGRLLDNYEIFQGSPEIDISHNTYNEIGQRVTEGLHSTGYTGGTAPAATITENTTITGNKEDLATTSVTLSPGFSYTAGTGTVYQAAIVSPSFAQTQEFRYNIRGWLSNINNGTLTNDGGVTESDPNALFGESITYNETSPLGATPKYNGNISGITWRNKIEQTGLPGVATGGQGYTFTYDNVDRLTQGTYYKQSGSSWAAASGGALGETISSYDEMGNILSLQRKDISGTATNNLTYGYELYGNKLVSVTDAGSQNITGTYTYDGNGNMITDTRKNITVTYNYLNLPDTVKQGSSRLVFTYDATGNKLYKQLITSGSIVSQRHYVEDVELTAASSITANGQVDNIAMAKGRIVNTGSNNYQYEYFLRDHLGNNRVSFRPNADGSLNLTQVQNYYPFGGDMGDATMNYTAAPQNLYKYNDKELQPELALNTYDFGARHYDPVLARWTAMDPLAEETIPLSPYNYVENNPMNLIDPDGMASGDPNGASQIPFGGEGLQISKAASTVIGSVAAAGGAAIDFINANKAFTPGQLTSNDIAGKYAHAVRDPTSTVDGGNAPTAGGTSTTLTDEKGSNGGNDDDGGDDGGKKGLRDMTSKFDKQLSDTRFDFTIKSMMIDLTSPQNSISNRIYKLKVFKNLVKTNAPYDLKKHGYGERDIGTFSIYHGHKFRYDDYGNYNFGVAARAYGISLDDAIRAAGIYQVLSGTGFLSNPSGWFDDPQDTQMIKNGYNHKFN